MSVEENLAAPETTPAAETSLGPNQNVLGALAYLFAPIGGVLVYLLEEDNEFARFHAAQSITFGLGAFLLFFTLSFFSTVLSMVAGDLLGILVWFVSSVVMFGLWFGVFVAWLYLFITAFQGKQTSLPVFGPLAEKHLL